VWVEYGFTYPAFQPRALHQLIILGEGVIDRDEYLVTLSFASGAVELPVKSRELAPLSHQLICISFDGT